MPPAKIAAPSARKPAKKATVPAALIEAATPKPLNTPLLSAIKLSVPLLLLKIPTSLKLLKPSKATVPLLLIFRWPGDGQ
jgi:hypothetical protein